VCVDSVCIVYGVWCVVCGVVCGVCACVVYVCGVWFVWCVCEYGVGGMYVY
jgi:hypothetical protein